MASVYQRTGKHPTWCVRWRDYDGKSRIKGFGLGREGKARAREFAKTLTAESQLRQVRPEDYRSRDMPWDDFKAHYEETHIAIRRPKTQASIRTSLANFERHCNPETLADLCTQNVLKFRTKRAKDPGHRSEFVSPATVNHDLRNLRTAANKAFQMELLPRPIHVENVKEIKRVARFMTPQQFEQFIDGTRYAQFPQHGCVTAIDWWKSLCGFLVLTGWRRGQAMSLLWQNVNLQTGHVFVDGEDTKGGRDEDVVIHDAAMDMIRSLLPLRAKYGPESAVFHFPNDIRTLYVDMHRIQDESGCIPAFDRKNDYQPHYGFHDFRRSFATWNAGRFSSEELQQLMQHKNAATTQRYVDMSYERRQIDTTAIVVPAGLPAVG